MPLPPSVRVLLPGDPDWPAAFERVAPRPKQIYVQGSLPRHPAVAVVGSRRADAYGLELARTLGAELARAGYAVVSGGALGIDGAAHAGALGAGGQTVAVLGCGIDVRYPPQHRPLLDEIASRGALVTELPPGTAPLPYHFPKRNRLIAALADAVVVVRAAARSGSLTTARCAAALGVPVLAAPGPAGDALSRGTNGLLRRGARLCESAADVLAVIEHVERHGPLTPALSPDRGEGAPLEEDDASSPPGERPGEGAPQIPPIDARVYELLSAVPVTADVLGREAELGAAEASAALTRLELSGLAVRSFGNLFHRQIGMEPR
ncbi:MAG: DNA-processing protein DprA [Myxococcales bacterium]